MRTLEQIKEIIKENTLNDRNTYDGLTDAEIGRYSQALMFGDNDEGFPTEQEWSQIVD